MLEMIVATLVRAAPGWLLSVLALECFGGFSSLEQDTLLATLKLVNELLHDRLNLNLA
jgi:hypothetical protein